MEDPFVYVLGLTDGRIVFFSEVVSHRNGWITIKPCDSPCADFSHDLADPGTGDPFPFDRGLEVQVSAIAWCADAGGYDS